MAARLRTLLLACFMMALAAGVTGISLRIIYQAALAEQRTRLLDVVGSHATLLDALGRLSSGWDPAQLPSGVFAATLGQTQFGASGELTVARREGEAIVFLLRHRGIELEHPAPVPLTWERVVPMRRALAGEWGTMVAPDYRGELVLAAYEYAPEVGLGIVAQVDLAEIRAPFMRAGRIAAASGGVLVLLAAALFVRMTNPFIRRLERRVAERTAELAQANAGLQGEVAERRQVEAQLLHHQEQLHLLAAELAMTEERERRQVAEELHDRIGQTLAVTQMRLDALRAVTAPPEQRQRLDEISALVDQMDGDIRTLTFELSPPVLQLGLDAGLRWLAEHVEAQHGLRVRVVQAQENLPLDDDTCALMFRAVRELLMNVVKHAAASAAQVELVAAGGRVVATVADGGVGFDPLAVTTGLPGGFGLLSVREGLASVGGGLELESAPGDGTTVRAWVPLRSSGPEGQTA